MLGAAVIQIRHENQRSRRAFLELPIAVRELTLGHTGNLTTLVNQRALIELAIDVFLAVNHLVHLVQRFSCKLAHVELLWPAAIRNCLKNTTLRGDSMVWGDS